MLKLIFSYHLSKYGKFRNAFTLTETLAGAIIGLILLGEMLSWLVNFMYQDKNEEILAKTQQNMDRAMEYMREDISGALYVYDFQQTPYNTCSSSPSACTSNVGNNYSNGNVLPYPLVGIPASLIAANYIPILAFWKLASLSNLNASICSGLSNSTYIPEDNPTITNGAFSYQGECNALLYRRKMMTLVVYFLKTNVGDSSDNGWYGPARILRYEFDKYLQPMTTYGRNTGFIDPTYSGNYSSWPENNSQKNLQASLPTISATNPAVLVDYVDDPKSTADSNFSTCDSTQSRTPAYPIAPANMAPGTYNGNYPTTYYSTSFWACVTTLSSQGSGNAWSSPAGIAQKVSIYLRGNAKGSDGLNKLNRVLPPIYTTISVRGVVGENY